MKNWRTTLGAVMTLIGFIPETIDHLQLVDTPNWLNTTGLVASALSFLWMSYQTKDKAVTGVGANAKTENELKR